MEQVQHYASVDARKLLEPGVAGGRYKPVSSVDRALVFSQFFFLMLLVPFIYIPNHSSTCQTGLVSKGLQKKRIIVSKWNEDRNPLITQFHSKENCW